MDRTEKNENVVSNPQIYSGFSHIGSCRAFIWYPKEEDGRYRFSFLDLCYSDSIETLRLRSDLYLCAASGEDYLVKDFQLTDVTNTKAIHGFAASISPLSENFIEVKAVLPNKEGMLSQNTQLKAIRTVSTMGTAIRNRKRLQLHETRETSGMLLAEIIKTPDAIINLLAVKSFDDYTYAHSINVATLALTIGHAMNLSKPDLQVLGTGALLHDVGRLRLDLAVLQKKGTLTDKEFEGIREHPRLGLEILKPCADLDPRVREIVLSHHEKFQGGGYPDGLKGKDIPLFARIVSIADVYDALTSPRPYRPPIKPYEAIRILLSNIDNQFDPEILAVFLKRVSLFPPGSMVRLSDGSVALVIRPNPGAHLRPIVRLVQDAKGNRAYTTGNLDLCQSPDLYVVGPVTEGKSSPP